MQDRTFELPVGNVFNVTYTLTADEKLTEAIMRKKTEIKLSDIRKIMVKNSGTMGTQVLRITYFDQKKQKEKKLMRLEAPPGHPDMEEFIALLKERFPDPAVWDSSKIKDFTEGNRKAYDMQVTMMGYAGSGLPRKGQIWIIYGIFSIFILPLPLLIYVLATKCFRVYTDQEGVEIRKYSSWRLGWDEITDVKVRPIKVRMYNEGIYIDSTLILRIRVYSRSGKSKKFKMRLLEGKPLLHELHEKGLVSSFRDEKEMFAFMFQ
ncbi:MAG: hypothetical protein KKD31_17470 [Bacteroidetes bacterium]|nr:hypothetical protein [Bacteroidota bacterium]